MHVSRTLSSRALAPLLRLTLLAALLSTAAHAAIFNDLVPSYAGMTQAGSTFTFNYGVTFSPLNPGDSLTAGDFFTLYDANPSSAQAPSSWVATLQNIGVTPGGGGVTVTDSSTVRNVTFQYTGPTLTTATPFVGFSVTSAASTVRTGEFSDLYHTSNGTNVASGQGLISVPAAAAAVGASSPEPSSWALLGFTVLGVSGLMLKARRRAARVPVAA